MSTAIENVATKGPDVADLKRLVAFEYRSSTLRRLRVVVEWQQLEWMDFRACESAASATARTCQDCPVRAECLAAALATDDQAEWRGGVARPERVELWNQLEEVVLALDQADT